MIKHSLNLLVGLAVTLYTRLSRRKIQHLDTDPRIPKLDSILAFANTALGDTLLSTPAMVSLKQSFPQAKLTLFVHRTMAPLFEGLEVIDGIVLYHGGYKKFLSTVLALRRVKPQAALLLHSNGPQDIPMAVLSGAKIILKPPTHSMYRHYLSHQFLPKAQHVIEEKLDLVRLIGGACLTTRMQLPVRYYCSTRQPLVVFKGRKIIGFQPGAANSFKMWPTENFAALANKLLETFDDIEIIITGSRKEVALGQRIVAGSNPARVHNHCGDYSIGELPDLIRQFDLLVSNDTGTMHLAIALGIPTLCLFGPTSAALIGPYQDIECHRVIQKQGKNMGKLPKKKRTNETMLLISVEEVFDTTVAMMQQPKTLDPCSGAGC